MFLEPNNYDLLDEYNHYNIRNNRKRLLYYSICLIASLGTLGILLWQTIELNK